jgi:hypothetical protein
VLRRQSVDHWVGQHKDATDRIPNAVPSFLMLLLRLCKERRRRANAARATASGRDKIYRLLQRRERSAVTSSVIRSVMVFFVFTFFGTRCSKVMFVLQFACKPVGGTLPPKARSIFAAVTRLHNTLQHPLPALLTAGWSAALPLLTKLASALATILSMAAASPSGFWASFSA